MVRATTSLINGTHYYVSGESSLVLNNYHSQISQSNFLKKRKRKRKRKLYPKG